MLTRTIGLSVIILAAGVAASAQCPVMPQGFICLSQSAANVAAANARENVALKDKIAVLEAGLTEKDKSIQELKDVNQKNVLDLTGQLNKVTADWAFEKGKNTSLEADKVLWTAVIDVLIKNSRKKSIGLIAF